MSEYSSTNSTHNCSDRYKLNSEEKLFTCQRCKMDGFGPRHTCTLCNYSVHKECLCPKQNISHDFLKSLTLTLSEKPSSDPKKCNACGKKIKGISYCHSPDLNLHPCCCHLDKTLINDGVVFHLKKKLEHNCSECKFKENKNPRTWGYESADTEERFHVYCMMERVHVEKMKNADRNKSTVESRVPDKKQSPVGKTDDLKGKQPPPPGPCVAFLKYICNIIITETIRDTIKSCVSCASQKVNENKPPTPPPAAE